MHKEKELWEQEWEKERTRKWGRGRMSDGVGTLKPVLPCTSQEHEPILFLIKLVLIGFQSLVIKSLDQCFRFYSPWLNETNLWSLSSNWEVPWARELSVCEILEVNNQRSRDSPSLWQRKAWRVGSGSHTWPASGLHTHWFRVWGGSV